MRRKQAVAGFTLALLLLSQQGCCCCVTLPVGPEPGEQGEFQLEPLAEDDAAVDAGIDTDMPESPAEDVFDSVESPQVDGPVDESED